MLNFRFLNALLTRRYIRIYLAILGFMGIGALLDVILLLKLSLLIGTWLTLAILALTTSATIVLAFHLVDKRSHALYRSISYGVFSQNNFVNYVTILLACPLIMLPGIVNSLFGLLILLQPLSDKIGEIVVRTTGINWSESYEILRLNTITET